MPRWWPAAPEPSDRNRLEADGFTWLADLDLVDVGEVHYLEGSADFHGHDEESILKLGEQDRHIERSQELLRSRRLRARRGRLEERVKAARGVVEHRRQGADEASRLLADARRELAGFAYRQLSDRTYRRRKVIFALGEAVSLAVAFSAAFDVAPAEAFLLSGAIALAFVVAGDLGGILRVSSERARLGTAIERDAVHLDPRFRHIVQPDGRRWITAVGCGAAGLFALAAVAVGVLRAADRGSALLAGGLSLLTVTLAMAAALSSWQHASVGCEVIDHLQREEAVAARRWRRASRARVLRRYDALGAKIDVRWRAAEERAEGRMRLAEARCGFFRARHPRVFGHGVRTGDSHPALTHGNGNGSGNGSGNGNGAAHANGWLAKSNGDGRAHRQSA